MNKRCVLLNSIAAKAAAGVVAAFLVTALLVCRSASHAANTVPAPTPEEVAAVQSIAVYPSDIVLDRADDYQGVMAVATRADGVTIDVTDQATWSVEGAARLDGTRLLPVADGQAVLKAVYGDKTAEAKVTVAGAGNQPPVSFRHDVMPLFLRGGCNAGGCHGAARGKDGFRLSLFGFDPAGDYHRLTREQAVRRINLSIPEESLLVLKATGAVPHTGGKKFEADSVYAKWLRDWVAGGAVNDVAEAPAVTKVELFPPRAVLEGEAARQRFIAVAHYADGRTRDVTNLALFMSNNDSSAAIDADGLVVAGKRGEAFVMARFDTHTVGSQVLVLPKGVPFTPLEEQPANYIDELVGAKLRTLRMNPSPVCTDEEFLRRVHLDIVGGLPTRAEYDAFMADASPAKRAAKIDELLGRKEFAELWAMKWSELLMVKSIPNRVEYKPMFLYSQWITRQIAGGVPLDEMVRSLLGASGGSFASPAVNFYQIEETTQKTAENVAQIFLGTRLQCAQCHNHPFDRWTMDDYYSFTAFFAQIGRKTGEDYRETIVFDARSGETAHLVDGRAMKPKFLGGAEPDTTGKDRRAVLAEWVTSPQNPYFAVNVANRVWAHFMGVGVVEPVDDVRISNPPSNPELHAALGAKLVEYKYDLRQLVRDICNSRAYQRSAVPNETNAEDSKNFAYARIRRIPAEALLDSLCQVTGAQEKFPGLPLGARAVQIADGGLSTYFLTTFGRAPRNTVCACEAKAEPTLSQALHMLNGSAVHDKIAQGRLIETMLETGKKPAEVVEEIFLRCLSRKPTEAELNSIAQLCGSAEKPVAELQDVFWAVLNSREFLFVH
ncbi:MAG: cell surface protein [Planctomycetota bacterium]|nr:MAG: cell surface protein [Planctomycetota bacterium]